MRRAAGVVGLKTIETEPPTRRPRKGITSGEFRPVDLAFVESVLGLFIYTFVWNRDGADARSMTISIMDVLIHGVSAVPRVHGAAHRLCDLDDGSWLAGITPPPACADRRKTGSVKAPTKAETGKAPLLQGRAR